MWQPGAERYLRPINNAVRNYWKLSKSGGPPDNFLEPSLHYILMDLIFTHEIYKGKSTLDFDSLFKICDANTCQGASKMLKLPKWKLQFSKFRLTYRAVIYFNFLPLKTRDLSAARFRVEAKKHILDNKQDYLNFTLDFNVVGKQNVKCSCQKQLEVEKTQNKRSARTFAAQITEPMNMALFIKNRVKSGRFGNFLSPSRSTKRSHKRIFYAKNNCQTFLSCQKLFREVSCHQTVKGYTTKIFLNSRIFFKHSQIMAKKKQTHRARLVTLSSDEEEATTTTPEAEAGVFEMVNLTVDSNGSKSSEVSIISNGEDLQDDESITQLPTTSDSTITISSSDDGSTISNYILNALNHIDDIADFIIDTIDADLSTPSFLREAERTIIRGRKFIQDTNTNEQRNQDADDEDEGEDDDDEMDIQPPTPPHSSDTDGHGDCAGTGTCVCPTMSNGSGSESDDSNRPMTPSLSICSGESITSNDSGADSSNRGISRDVSIISGESVTSNDSGEDSSILEISREISEISGETNLEVFSANATTTPIPAATNPNRTIAIVRPRQLQTGVLANNQPGDIVRVASWGSDHVPQLSDDDNYQDPYFMDVSF